MVVSRPASDGATTHPEVVEGILLYLQNFGVAMKNVSIIESAWVGDDTRRAFKVCGYEDLRKRYGVSLHDLKSDKTTGLTFKGCRIDVCNRALETGFLINVPVLKAHSQTRLTCCLKNLKGCIPDGEKRSFHSQGLHKPIAALNGLLKTGYNVVDSVCGDLSFEEGGTPTYAGRVLVGRCPVMVDSFCAELIGLRAEDVGYLELAESWGIGRYFSPQTSVIELNASSKPTREAKASRAAERYKKLIDEDGACSACYAALVHALHRSEGRLGSGKFHIGQGYRNKPGDGVGIGSCTKHSHVSIPGCPPKAVDIIEGVNKL